MSIPEMSFAASVLIGAIVIVRAVGLYRLPKKVFLCLWGIAALRLLVPFSIPLPFIITVDLAAPVSNLAAVHNTYTTLETAVRPDGAATPIPIALIIWLTGICACALFFAVSYFKSLKEFKTSLPIKSEFIDRWLQEHPLQRSIQIRQTDRTRVPLTYGISHPVILLPKRMDLTDEASLHYVLAHEYIHIRHFDILTKLILTATVCVHWFNPLVWLMYILANRDIELICDETVVNTFGQDGKSTYALTLIGLEEIKSRGAIVNYFSKNFVEERMTAIMKAKKYTLPVMIIALMLVFGAATVFAATTSATDKRVGENTALSLCNVTGCNEAGVHQHSGRYYYGHSAGDGHNYHAVCNVEGCTEMARHEHHSTTSSSGTALSLCNVTGCNETGIHQHSGRHYYGHSAGDGHNYHAVCNVEGCMEVAKHEHQSITSSSNVNGHHNSGHGRGGHH